MMGIAVYAPMVTRNRAPYWTLWLSWTEMRVAKPAMATRIAKMAKDALCLSLSDANATHRENAKAAAHGGTLRKVSVSVRRDNKAEVHEATDDDLVVLEHVEGVAESGLALGAGVALISAQSCRDVVLLLWGEPLRLLGEAALKDEDPAPAGVATHATHLADGGGEKTAECAGEGGAVEEEGVAALGLVSAVPHADETLEQSGQAEEEHVETQPDMGLKALEEDVGGDLEEDVGHEEDDERGVVFRLFKTELLGEAKYIGIGNVYTVCIARLIHDTQERNNMEVDLGHELAIGRTRWTNELKVVCMNGVASTIGSLRVIWIVASNAAGETPAEVGDNPSMTLKRKSKIHWGSHVDTWDRD
ncbi:hypothetical protein HG530_000795 [Fusarium avenaceum]|nr:hypothetical protein HG530_000795 [Fusarium avenaceum]